MKSLFKFLKEFIQKINLLNENCQSKDLLTKLVLIYSVSAELFALVGLAISELLV